jgi:hypothetical protein
LQGGGVYVKGGTVAISVCTISGNTAGYVRALMLKSKHCLIFPIALMGDSRFARCLQGGGVAVSNVYGGLHVTITSSWITRNTVNVRAHI